MKSWKKHLLEIVLIVILLFFIALRHFYPFHIKGIFIAFVIITLLAINCIYFIAEDFKIGFYFPKYLGLTCLLLGLLFRLEHWKGYTFLIIVSILFFLIVIGNIIYKSEIRSYLFTLLFYSILMIFSLKSIGGINKIELSDHYVGVENKGVQYNLFIDSLIRLVNTNKLILMNDSMNNQTIVQVKSNILEMLKEVNSLKPNANLSMLNNAINIINRNMVNTLPKSETDSLIWYCNQLR